MVIYVFTPALGTAVFCLLAGTFHTKYLVFSAVLTNILIQTLPYDPALPHLLNLYYEDIVLSNSQIFDDAVVFVKKGCCVKREVPCAVDSL